jgi:chromosome segregation ATPase
MNRRYPFLTLASFASILLAADKADGGSGSAPAATEKPTTLSAAQTRIDALEQGLTERDNQISTLTGERDQARTDLATANTTIGTLTGERDQARADLATANTTIGTLTGERDQARTDHATATVNVTRLEKLAGVHGININEAPAASESTPVSLAEQWEEAKKDPAKKADFIRTNRAAIKTLIKQGARA